MKFYPVLEPVLGAKEKEYVNECLDSGWISSNGKYVKKFEDAFASYNGMQYARAASNGTVTLHLIMLALGIKEGDEVLVPDFTYVATANAVLYVGAKPVFVDGELSTYNIDPTKIEEKITPKTKAIIITHLFGNPCRMDEIVAIARKHNLHLVEDAAEAHGALYNGQMVGTFGIANSYSFFGNKTISTGEGGMVVTNVKEIEATVSLLRNQGQSPTGRRYYHEVLAYNYRMTNMQAAVGLAQIEQIDTFIKNKKAIHAWYRELLAPLIERGIVTFQSATPNSDPSWWVTAIRIQTPDFEKKVEDLRGKGVDTRPFFYPMHKMPYMRESGDFKNADMLAEQGLIIPSSSSLTKEDIRVISDILIETLS